MKNPANNVKFAVVGCGHAGKRHAEVIKYSPEAELVALIDSKSKELLDIEKYNVPFFSSLKSFLSSNLECDVVNIATPNGYHAEQAMMCLNAKNHIVVEKPMTLTKADAEKVIFKALHVHKHLFVVMQNRYSPSSIWLKEMVESGRLGDIYLVQVNCYWNRDNSYYHKDTWHGDKSLDGGTLFTQFSHFIDIIYWLFGDITNIHARFNNFNHKYLTDFEDSGIVSFDFLSGGMGCISYSTSLALRYLESNISIISENGFIKVNGKYMDKVETCNVREYDMPKLPPINFNNGYKMYKKAVNHNHVIKNVIDVIKGRDTITTNALEGLKVVEIVERIYNCRLSI